MERLTQPEEDALRVLWPLPAGGFVKDVLDGLPSRFAHLGAKRMADVVGTLKAPAASG